MTKQAKGLWYAAGVWRNGSEELFGGEIARGHTQRDKCLGVFGWGAFYELKPKCVDVLYSVPSHQ